MKQLCFIMAFLMFLSLFQSAVFAAEPPPRTSAEAGLNNGYIAISIDEESGRFSVLPSEMSADVPAMSFGTFNINGAYYVFGQHVPGAGTSLSSVISHNNAKVLQWTIYDFVIQQHLMIIEDKANENAFAAHIVYDVLHMGGDDSEISMRLLLDTQLGFNDGAPVIIDGMAHFGEFALGVDSDTRIPDFFRASASVWGPWAYGLFRDGSGHITEPERVVFASFANAERAAFRYEPDMHQSLYPDSALLYFFPVQRARPGERLQFSTVYGFFGLGAPPHIRAVLRPPRTWFSRRPPP